MGLLMGKASQTAASRDFKFVRLSFAKLLICHRQERAQRRTERWYSFGVAPIRRRKTLEKCAWLEKPVA
jgi:hypothetical protein